MFFSSKKRRKKKKKLPSISVVLTCRNSTFYHVISEKLWISAGGGIPLLVFSRFFPVSDSSHRYEWFDHLHLKATLWSEQVVVNSRVYPLRLCNISVYVCSVISLAPPIECRTIVRSTGAEKKSLMFFRGLNFKISWIFRSVDLFIRALFLCSFSDKKLDFRSCCQHLCRWK